MIKQILLIGAGGFIGSVARYFVSMLNLRINLFSIPIGTLVVNITGCFVIGVLTGIADRSTVLTQELRLFLMVGLCGGFTTFSTFASENLTLMHNGQFASSIVYTALSLLLGFIAVYSGYLLTKII